MKIRSWGKLIVIILGLLFLINLSKDILRLWRAGDRLGLAEKNLEGLREENLRLREEKEFLESPLFLEQQIRDKLNMAKSDEMIVILPQGIEAETQEAEAGRKEGESLAVWQEWLALFW